MCTQYIFMAILTVAILPLLFPNQAMERLSSILVILICLGGISGIVQKLLC